ncbi:uncharacterized protein LOC112595309 [Melanaphis sacchari]|uniref:uncharacterized protein LOC112595309 n=1 Tax=Melanaphis sacchari TaxID=742174 RepID=UPI000DC131E0|nr:uncharacterized protein LOC112595309 [Melanaphis sacchari]
MSKNDVDECMSARCCCRLIIEKCKENPASPTVAKPHNGLKHAKSSEMSLCDFLKSQPVSDWIKPLQDNRVGSKDTKDKQRGPQELVTVPGLVNRICQQPPPADREEKHPHHHHRDIKPNPQIQPTTGVLEDRFMSQIIINIGTITTDKVCKRDSCQQTDPEVQTTVSPPTNLPTSTCPPVERPTSICPPADKPISVCPPVERPTSICPSADKPTSVCSPVKRPIAVILPKVHLPVVESIPVTRDRTCRYRGNAQSTVPSTQLKPGIESENKKKMNCCCACHSDGCLP